MLLERLEKQTGLSRSKLERYASTASKRYKTYFIQKRMGGQRKIEQPSKEIKALQRWLTKNLFALFDVHPSATAYFKGASIRSNASRHALTRFTLRVDFCDFFNRFTEKNVKDFVNSQNLKNDIGLSIDDIEFICAIVLRNGCLTIGAPSSPILTNAMMFDFDHALSTICEQRGLVYTRYADDIFVSAFHPFHLDGIFDQIASLAKAHAFGSLRINKKKTAYLSRRYKRTITGLVITPEGKVSISRAHKRRIKALVHEWTTGSLPVSEIAHLQGTLAYVSDVERTFYNALCLKYGKYAIDGIEKA